MQEHDINSLRCTVKRAQKHLGENDRVMAALIAQYGPCTMFENHALLHKPPFHVLVWAIINQQLSVASAASIEQRLLSLHQGRRFQPGTLQKLSDRELRQCGLSRQKIRYLRALCEAVHKHRLCLHTLHDRSDDEIADILIKIPGIGPWTIDMFLMFALARLDVLPLGDLALRRAITQQYAINPSRQINELENIAQGWQPFRSIASWYLWCTVD